MVPLPRLPIAVVVLTYNEEQNLPHCLASVTGWVGETFVVDSGSTDRTVEIADHYGARVVTHPFESHARQWNWALQNLPIRSAWILGLDADQQVTSALRHELQQLLTDPAIVDGGPAGYFVKRKNIFRGQWIKYGGYYPKYLLKLFRRRDAWVDERDLVDHHFRVHGKVALLQHDMVENNRNEADISAWVEKHCRYAALQAQEELSRTRHGVKIGIIEALRGSPDDRVQWLKSIWGKQPLYVRPFLLFLYRYIARLGFLDGKAGFIFHFLQGFWYRLLVDIKLDDLRQQQARETGHYKGKEAYDYSGD